MQYAALAAFALTTAAWAQEEVFYSTDQARAIAPANPYQPRGDMLLYGVGTPQQTGGVWTSGGCTAYDEADFSAIYSDSNAPLYLNGIGYSLIFPTCCPQQIYARFSFYPSHTSTGATGLPPYSGTPVVAFLDTGQWQNISDVPQVFYYEDPVAVDCYAVLSSANVFDGGPADRTVGVKIELFYDAAGTVRATDHQVGRRAGFAGWLAGSSDTFGWFNCASNGEILQSQRSGGGALATSVQPNVNSGNCRATFMSFAGTTTPPIDVIATDLGALTDAGIDITNIQVGTTNETAAWFRFTLPRPADDPHLTFLDIDAEGSAADLSLFLIWERPWSAFHKIDREMYSDEDDGSGTNPMLTFGMGRRAAAAGGRPYDGRDFGSDNSRGLPAGTYYLCLAPAGSTYLHPRGINPGPVGGVGQLHIRTNVNGTPLAPSVAPAIKPENNMGRLTSTTTSVAALPQPRADPRWIQFTTCSDASDADPVTISFEGTSSQSSLWTLFTSTGAFVARQYTSSQAPTAPAPVTFNTANPLPAGTYDLALLHYQPYASSSTGGRWHVRDTSSRSGDPFAAQVTVVSTCPLICGTADFNGDGDLGTDSDIEAFFQCLAGTCCPTCFPGGADFNADGDSGTDADIESFFRVLAGGLC